MRILVGLSLLSCLASPPAWAQSAAQDPTPEQPATQAAVPAETPGEQAQLRVAPHPPGLANMPFVFFATLQRLRDQGLISQAEFDSALSDMGETMGPRAADSTTLVLGKWTTTIYGFAQADVMYHTTQSFGDYAGNGLVLRPDTYGGSHGRTTFSARDSRIGLRVAAPEQIHLRASALIEMDFLGSGPAAPPAGAESTFFNNPVLRFRHAYFKLETPVVDILVGQTWHLFGYQPNYIPTDVQWSGVVGGLFSRTMQVRVSKTLTTRHLVLEAAVAGMRPGQRDSTIPDGEAGLRISFPDWSAVHTGYMTMTNTTPASIAVSGAARRFTLPAFSALPLSSATATSSQTGLGIAVDAYLPIVRATKERRSNSLSVIGEFVEMQGMNDMYVGLTGGVTTQVPAGATEYALDVDPGMAVYDVNNQLRLPTWRNFIVGLEYYLPGVGGRVGLFGNYARTQLLDSKQYVKPAATRDNEQLWNAGLFVDVSDAVRLGADWGMFVDQYADGVQAKNHAVQMSGFFFF